MAHLLSRSFRNRFRWPEHVFLNLSASPSVVLAMDVLRMLPSATSERFHSYYRPGHGTVISWSVSRKETFWSDRTINASGVESGSDGRGRGIERESVVSDLLRNGAEDRFVDTEKNSRLADDGDTVLLESTAVSGRRLRDQALQD